MKWSVVSSWEGGVGDEFPDWEMVHTGEEEEVEREEAPLMESATIAGFLGRREESRVWGMVPFAPPDKNLLRRVAFLLVLTSIKHK